MNATTAACGTLPVLYTIVVPELAGTATESAVHLVDLSAGGGHDDVALLDADERRRCSTFASARQREYAAARAVLKRLLADGGDPAQVTLGIDARGKPLPARIAGKADRAFNLSHCDGLLAVVVGNGRLGIDLESLRPANGAVRPWDDDIALARFAHRHMRPSLCGLLLTLPPARRPLALLRLWTLSEAALKAVGEGVRAPLPQPSDEDAAWLLADDEDARPETASRPLRLQVADRGSPVFARLLPAPRPGLALAVARFDSLDAVR